MAPAGVEVIVGGRRDAVFGPAVLVGLGGILAEVLDDVAVLLAPVDADVVRAPAASACAARRSCAGCAAARARTWTRWRRWSSPSAAFLVANPDVLEVDLNPVIAGPDGAVAVDALLVVEGPSPA